MKTPLFIISFLRRYWKLLVVFVAVVMLGHFDAVTYFVGPIFYLVELAIGAMVACLFVKHVALRRSVDAYTENPPGGDSFFVQEWRALAPEARVRLTIYVLIGLFLGCAWIAASIAK